jgi:hypothetical protein
LRHGPCGYRLIALYLRHLLSCMGRSAGVRPGVGRLGRPVFPSQQLVWHVAYALFTHPPGCQRSATCGQHA